MKKEDFFEVLGELDDDIVRGAKMPVKKKMNWNMWGRMAACFALVLFIGALALNALRNGDEVVAPGIADAAPMVYVNDTLYIQSSDQQGYLEWKDGFVYLGRIVSDISADGVPKENFHANDPIVGCEVYQYGENIVVKINGAYWLYMKYGEKEVTWDSLTESEKQRLDPHQR